MTALLLVEARRALSRRLVRMLILAALTATAVTAIVVFVNADDETATEDPRLSAEITRRQIVDDCARFEADRATCEQRVPPATVFLDQGDDRFRLTDLWPTGAEGEDDGVLQGTAVPLIIAALLAGASVVGAEWRAGTMGLLLTWEPRRVRVLVAKGLVVLVLAAAIGLALQAVMVGALVPAALLRGTTEGADADWWRSLVGGMLRIAGVTGLAALMGASLASIARNTAGALGIAFGYLAVAENMMRGLRPRWSRWFVSDNIAVVVTGDPTATGEFRRTVTGSALLVTVYLVALFLVALTAFRTRDVT